MLRVRVNEQEFEVTPVALAPMVWDGVVDRHHLARHAEGAGEQPLERSLGASYCESLARELLCRLQLLACSDPSAQGIRELRTRVEQLSEWRLGNPHVEARLLWVAGWLNELTDRLENAVSFYDRFLQTCSRDNHLRLLAYNNRGVSRVRLGRLEGVQDLARASIPVVPSAERGPASAGLPAACFNLLNLVRVAVRADSLAAAVDEELVEFFAQGPNDLRFQWLGDGQAGRAAEESTRCTTDSTQQSWPSSCILRDVTYRRLNALTSSLAAHAVRLSGGEPTELRNEPDRTAARLSLWDCGPTSEAMNVKGADETPLTWLRDHDRYVEAASLLLCEEIPSVLIRRESPLSLAQQLAQEDLAQIENHLELGEYDMARARLRVQRKILVALNEWGQLTGVIGRIDAQLRRIALMERARMQLDLQRMCARLVSEVDRFCTLRNLYQAERNMADLRRDMDRLRDQLSPDADAHVRSLLDELVVRCERRLRDLRRADTEQKIRQPLQELRRSWPTDWTSPVPDSVRVALTQCRLMDPYGEIEDWSHLQRQLDGHEARHRIRRALDSPRGRQLTRDQLEDVLADALCLDPDMWSEVAPLFGLLDSSTSKAASTRGAAHTASTLLIEAITQDSRRPQVRRGDDFVHPAGPLLEKVLSKVRSEPEKLACFWRRVEGTLSPVLATGDAEEITRVISLAEQFRDQWPAGDDAGPRRMDPRNPVNLFLESCEKVRLVVEAEQCLHSQPTRTEQAGEYYRRALRSGLKIDSRLKSAVTGLYLAALGRNDAPAVQREMLARLDAWFESMEEQERTRLRECDIAVELGRIRADIARAQQASTEDSPSAEEPAARDADHPEPSDPLDRGQTNEEDPTQPNGRQG